MKYTLLTVVSMMILAATALFLIDLFGSKEANTEFKSVAQISHDTLPISASVNDQGNTAAETCDPLLEDKLLSLLAEPQVCQRHHDCQLKSLTKSCDSVISNKTNAPSCLNALTIDCGKTVDSYQYQALCIKNQCEKSKVIKVKADPKTFTINKF